MRLVVGLGNPGPQYENTRHNVGFAVIDQLALVERKGFSSEYTQVSDVIFAKPQTWMNSSGLAVHELKAWFKPTEIVVIHDDIELEMGRINVKRGGGTGGHNGLKSIDAAIGSDYIRVRAGVGKGTPVLKYVLEKFPDTTAAVMLVDDAVEVVKSVLDFGLEKTQTMFNGLRRGR